MLDWSLILEKPEFWAQYYEGYFGPEADAELLHHIWGTHPAFPSATWSAFDLRNAKRNTTISLLQQLDRHGGSPAEAARRMDRGFGEEWISRMERALREALEQRDALPEDKSIPLRFNDGTTWRIRFEPGPADVHLLEEKDGSPLVLGWTGAHFAAPVLRADEARALAASLRRQWQGDFDPKWLPMLLQPIVGLGRKDDARAHRAWLLQAWVETKLLSEQQAQQLVRRTSKATSKAGWRIDSSYGWVNDFPHSHRNPVGGWPNQELGEVFLRHGFSRFAAFWRRCIEQSR